MKKLITILLALLLTACSTTVKPMLATQSTTNVPSIYSTIQKCVDNSTVCNVAAGTYIGTIKIIKSGVTLNAVGKVYINGAVLIFGTGNTVRGFTISGKNEKAGIRLYGSGNVAEGNIIYDTLEDGIWFWGNGHKIINNYIGYDPDKPEGQRIQAIHDDRGWPSYDNHVDCYMVMSWDGGSSNGVVFDGNTCIHNRAQGSNQGAMINGNIINLTFKNNVFVFYDAAYAPAFALFEGSGFVMENNYICNTTGKGESVAWLQNISSVSMHGNRYAGYNLLYKGGVTPLVNGNVRESLPCVFGDTITSTDTPTPTKTATVTPTQTTTPSMTPTITKSFTPTPSSTPTSTPTLTPTPTATNTPTPVIEMCIKVTWPNGLNLRETASMGNSGKLGFLNKDTVFHPVSIETNREGTFAQYGNPGWVAMWLKSNGKTYAVETECQ